jgi:capsular polysaccharide biosynthesis protein
VEEPLVGADPINIRPVFNTAIAIVLGGMVALGLVFILEYFEKNPLQS